MVICLQTACFVRGRAKNGTNVGRLDGYASLYHGNDPRIASAAIAGRYSNYRSRFQGGVAAGIVTVIQRCTILRDHGPEENTFAHISRATPIGVPATIHGDSRDSAIIQPTL